MQPPYSNSLQAPDLDAAFANVGMGARWAPGGSVDHIWNPPPPSPPRPYYSADFAAAPVQVPTHASPPHTYTPRLSPTSSPSSLTDRDISRRTLAANGLDVSAPEFVPAFAAASSPPAHQSAPALTPPSAPAYDMHQPTRGLYHHATLHNTSAHLTPPHQEPLHAVHPFYASDSTGFVQRDPDPTYFSASPSQSLPHLDEATYVTAVQHFDEEFPALAKPQQQEQQTSATSNASQCWGSDIAASPTPAEPGESLQSIFPKALGWNALQREEARKYRDAVAAQQWQAALDEYTNSLEAEFDEFYDEAEDTRVSSDIGGLWVTTGQSVGQLYQSLRAEAAEEARLRNKYFDRATAAFKKKDGASAKRLGTLGREANDRMKELHRRAAEAIFEARNPPNVTDVIDLHGLHVSEALERMPAAFEKAPPGILRVLTGTGHHTKGTGRARLRPAVKKWLQDNGYFFEEVIDANEYIGSFKVEIRR